MPDESGIKRNPDWTRDELVLGSTVFCSCRFGFCGFRFFSFRFFVCGEYFTTR